MATTGRPTLDYWLGEYAAIAEEFVDGLQADGIGFAPPMTAAQRELRAATMERLAAKGARFMNGGASVSTGFLSSACRACCFFVQKRLKACLPHTIAEAHRFTWRACAFDIKFRNPPFFLRNKKESHEKRRIHTI